MERRSVQSREYKVMLQPRQFNGGRNALLRAAGAWWGDFCGKASSVVIEAKGELAAIKTERLIRFVDTSKERLNDSRYIFRERRAIDSGAREVTLKFRHGDRFVALDRRMDAASPPDQRTKFEEDIKAPFVSLYSFSTTLPIGNERAYRDLGDLAHLFPDIRVRLPDFAEREPVAVVHDFTAREVVIGGGSVKIGKHPGVDAECALIVWYDHGGRNDTPVAVEFSYRYGDKDEHYGGAMARRAFETFQMLQSDLTRWVDPNPRTKTAFVYQ
jgi:hypothetical protein